eukprot:8364339-Alexandrium_andersonii.AAC.1
MQASTKGAQASKRESKHTRRGHVCPHLPARPTGHTGTRMHAHTHARKQADNRTAGSAWLAEHCS